MDERSRTEQYLGTFTSGWKDLCREMLKIYARVSERRRKGRTLSPAAIRDIIMEPYPEYGPKEGLSPDNMYDWIKERTNIMDDISFSFIDEFIRKLQFDDASYSHIRRVLYEAADDEFRRSLTKLYMYGKSPRQSEPQKEMSVLDNAMFMSKPMSNAMRRAPSFSKEYDLPFVQLALYFRSYRDGMFSVVAMYTVESLFVLEQRSKIWHKDRVLYFGYFIPQFPIDGELLCGTLHLVRQGVDGILFAHPNTISLAAASLSLQPVTLVTDWFPQVFVPLVRWLNIEPLGFDLPGSEGGQSDDGPLGKSSQFNRGRAILDKQDNEFPFIREYLRNLTNEYLIW